MHSKGLSMEYKKRRLSLFLSTVFCFHNLISLTSFLPFSLPLSSHNLLRTLIQGSKCTPPPYPSSSSSSSPLSSQSASQPTASSLTHGVLPACRPPTSTLRPPVFSREKPPDLYRHPSIRLASPHWSSGHTPGWISVSRMGFVPCARSLSLSTAFLGRLRSSNLR